ncbi:M23 family metallopeptidase [bacterium]|jgi:murein DD-endopeptidase MepM/ murein hydrolase activator NlpD|nr:M23 family metallopeptidase [bacterium]
MHTPLFINRIRLGAILGLVIICSTLHAESGVRIALSSHKVNQGDTIKVEILTRKALDQGTIKLNGHTFSVFRNPNKTSRLNYSHRYIGYVGISRKLKPRRYLLDFSLKYLDKTRYKTQFKLWVKDGRFKKEHITLSKKKKSIQRDYSTLGNENATLKKAITPLIRKKLFNYPFILPVKGRLSSPYGGMRIYNNRPAWSHSGIDIAAPKGTPIKAANSGKVTLVDSFKVHGNTLVIDHGFGITTIYNHLEKAVVKVGDRVRKGQIVGHVGSTGVATGPHVHWGLTVGRIRVNPRVWLTNRNLYDY